MHNNFYFLRQLSTTLERTLKGTVISECFSQSKDELIIRFETTGSPFFIRTSLAPTFSCVSFPSDFQRGRKNNIDLFPALIGQRVDSIQQFDNERSFAIHFKEDILLLFKLHGNRSNIILFEKEEVTAIFKNSLPADQEINIDSLNRQVTWTFDNFIQHQKNPDKPFFTLGKLVWAYLKEHQFDSVSAEDKWLAIQHVRAMLEQPEYFITDYKSTLHLSLLPIGNIQSTFQDPVQAVNEFFNRFIREETFLTEKRTALSKLQKAIQGGENYVAKNQSKLEELTADNNYKTWADLIMANMHAIKSGLDQITLPDFYRENHTVEIKLKKELSPQKNAEVYYRKAKKQHIEIEQLQQNIAEKEQELNQLRTELAQIENLSSDLKALRSLTEKSNSKREQEKQVITRPYHEFEHNGFKIWVGKSAQANDELTLKYSYKEDLWLHVKDVPGSHVLIKYQSGKNFPKDVIERAAQLAAYNSKRKTETLCSVSVTPKKFVRKRKGDPAGAVVVEKEEVILVEPRL